MIVNGPAKYFVNELVFIRDNIISVFMHTTLPLNSRLLALGWRGLQAWALCGRQSSTCNRFVLPVGM